MTTAGPRVLAALFAIALLTSCGGAGQRAAPAESAQVSVTVQAIGPEIALVVVSVTASDIAVPLVFNVPIQNGTAEKTLGVPAGASRRFTAEAYDAAGAITHEGTATVDVARGQNGRVDIPMVPREGRVPVDVTIGAVTIALSPTEIALDAGASAQIAATVRSASGAVLDVTPAWASTNPSAAIVDAAGHVTAVGAGVADIVATYSGSSATARVTVSGAVATVPAPLVVEIESVPRVAPGGVPSVDFRVQYEGAPRDIITSPLSSLRAIVAGPTTDYQRYAFVTIQGPGAAGTLSAIDVAQGRFHYELPASAAIPATATGTFALGLEAYVALDANQQQRTPAIGPVAYFAVTDAVPSPRRDVVSDAACDVCHGAVLAHGDARRGVRNCVLCHSPSQAAEQRVSRLEGGAVTAPSIGFKSMMHAMHRGGALTRPYIVWRFPGPTAANPAGTPYDASTGPMFPGDLAACTTCHLSGTYALPLPSTAAASREVDFTCDEAPSSDANDYCEIRTGADRFVPPATAACTSCHDSADTAVHAQVNTNSSGQESCATCHGQGRTFAH